MGVRGKGAGVWERLTDPSPDVRSQRQRVRLRFFIGLLVGYLPAMWLTVGLSYLLGEQWAPKALAAAACSVLVAIVYPLLRSGRGVRVVRGVGCLAVVVAVVVVVGRC